MLEETLLKVCLILLIIALIVFICVGIAYIIKECKTMGKVERKSIAQRKADRAVLKFKKSEDKKDALKTVFIYTYCKSGCDDYDLKKRCLPVYINGRWTCRNDDRSKE